MCVFNNSLFRLFNENFGSNNILVHLVFLHKLFEKSRHLLFKFLVDKTFHGFCGHLLLALFFFFSSKFFWLNVNLISKSLLLLLFALLSNFCRLSFDRISHSCYFLNLLLLFALFLYQFPFLLFNWSSHNSWLLFNWCKFICFRFRRLLNWNWFLFGAINMELDSAAWGKSKSVGHLEVGILVNSDLIIVSIHVEYLEFLFSVDFCFLANFLNLLHQFIIGLNCRDSLQNGLIIDFEGKFDLEIGYLGLVHFCRLSWNFFGRTRQKFFITLKLINYKRAGLIRQSNQKSSFSLFSSKFLSYLFLCDN